MNFDQHYGSSFQGTFSIPVICPPPSPPPDIGPPFVSPSKIRYAEV